MGAFRFEVYADAQGEGRWRLLGRNGKILADGGEGYSRERDARRAVRRLQQVAQALASAETVQGEKPTTKRAITKGVVGATETLQELVVQLGTKV